jgi:hypothetical protein
MITPDRIRLPHSKEDIGMILSDERERNWTVVGPKSFWTRLKERLFGPRQLPLFYVGLRRPFDSNVEVASVRRIRPRDGTSDEDLHISFRFIEGGDRK